MPSVRRLRGVQPNTSQVSANKCLPQNFGTRCVLHPKPLKRRVPDHLPKRRDRHRPHFPPAWRLVVKKTRTCLPDGHVATPERTETRANHTAPLNASKIKTPSCLRTVSRTRKQTPLVLPDNSPELRTGQCDALPRDVPRAAVSKRHSALSLLSSLRFLSFSTLLNNKEGTEHIYIDRAEKEQPFRRGPVSRRDDSTLRGLSEPHLGILFFPRNFLSQGKIHAKSSFSD